MKLGLELVVMGETFLLNNVLLMGDFKLSLDLLVNFVGVVITPGIGMLDGRTHEFLCTGVLSQSWENNEI